MPGPRVTLLPVALSSQPMSDALFAKVLDTWHRNLVILFRDQQLSEDDQVRFGARFGPPAVSHTKRFTTANPAVIGR